jgi:hypothetical protein
VRVTVSFSPRPHPSRTSSRNNGPGTVPFNPERIKIIQPRVARPALPWVHVPKHFPNPERVASTRPQPVMQPFQDSPATGAFVSLSSTEWRRGPGRGVVPSSTGRVCSAAPLPNPLLTRASRGEGMRGQACAPRSEPRQQREKARGPASEARAQGLEPWRQGSEACSPGFLACAQGSEGCPQSSEARGQRKNPCAQGFLARAQGSNLPFIQSLS